MCQIQYLINLLRSCDLTNLWLGETLMAANIELHLDEEPIQESKECRQVIGFLQYMTLTQLNIQLAVNKLS